MRKSHCLFFLVIRISFCSVADELDGTGTRFSRRLAEDPMQRILHFGGPLCKEIVEGSKKAKCDMPNCGEYHLWHRDLFGGRRKSKSTPSKPVLEFQGIRSHHPMNHSIDSPPAPSRRLDALPPDLLHHFSRHLASSLTAPHVRSSTFHRKHYGKNSSSSGAIITSKYERNPFGYSSTQRKIVVSVGHNGFGNQLFQHYFGYRLAQHTHAKLYLTSIDKFSPGRPPPNTLSGASLVGLITEDALEWDRLPPDHGARRLCRASNFTFSVRPKDFRFRHNRSKFLEDITSFLDPREGAIRCVFLIGYFIDRNVCIEDVRKIWSALVDPMPHFRGNITVGAQPGGRGVVPAAAVSSPVPAATGPGGARSFLTAVLPYHRDDIVVHMRCSVGHDAYTSHGIKFFESIFNNTLWRNLYIIIPPTTCRGTYYLPFKYLLSLPNASVISSDMSDSGTMDDLILMILAPRFVEDKISSLSFWAGIFSNSSEVYVDIRSHGVVSGANKFIYHDSLSSNCIGRYNASCGKSENSASFCFV